MKSTPLVVLDLETTGLSPYKDRITEIAASKVQDGEVIDTFHTLINPEIPIPHHITRITGITDSMVQDQPTIRHVLDDLKTFLEDHPIVAHNASFDFNFLKYNFLIEKEHKLTNQRICTARLARRILSHLPSKKLGSICEYYNIVNESAHRAGGDVDATVKVLSKFTETLSQVNITTISQVYKFQSTPVAKASQLLSNTRNL